MWKSASSSVLAAALPDNLRGGSSEGRVRLGGDARSLLAAALERSHLVLLTASAVQPFFLVSETDLLSSPAGAFQLQGIED